MAALKGGENITYPQCVDGKVDETDTTRCGSASPTETQATNVFDIGHVLREQWLCHASHILVHDHGGDEPRD